MDDGIHESIITQQKLRVQADCALAVLATLCGDLLTCYTSLHECAIYETTERIAFKQWRDVRAVLRLPKEIGSRLSLFTRRKNNPISIEIPKAML